jgi:hypothetical protein
VKRTFPMWMLAARLLVPGEALADEMSDLIELCHQKWVEHDGARPEGARLGDPFALLDRTTAQWVHAVELDGRSVSLAPTAHEELLVDDPALGEVTCQVPVAWRATVNAVELRFDPILRRQQQLTRVMGQIRSGHEALGGLYARHFKFGLSQPYDFALTWSMEPVALSADTADRLRAQLTLPFEQPLELRSAAEGVAPGENLPAIAITFDNDPGFPGQRLWGFLSAADRAAMPAYRFLPRRPATSASTLASAVNTFNAVGLSTLSVWDTAAHRRARCSAGDRNPDLRCDGLFEAFLYPKFRQAFDGGAPLCVRLLWRGGEQLYTTSACIQPDGSLSPSTTAPVDDLSSLGLPSLQKLERP